jgi:hypothetical protein
MRIKSLAFSVFIFLSGEVFSQFIQLGNGAYLGTVAGPIIQRNNVANYQSKYAYIFPQGVLGNMKHGDSLISLSFMRSEGATFNGNCSLRMWLHNVNISDWGSSPISFKKYTDSATQVYHNHPQTHIGPDDRFYKIPFDKPYVFDSTQGSNLALLVFYEQMDTIKGSIRFYFEGSVTVSGYYSPQVRYSIGASADDSLRNATEYHPTIQFSFPREIQDIEVRKVYTLGRIPVPLGNPDSVKVLLRNVGKNDLLSYPCYTYSKGANKQKDSFYVNLRVGEETFVNVPSLSPSLKGTDTVFVESKDKNTSNNSGFSLRLANENIYSYRDVSKAPAPGGIGFNGSQGDFVARFQSNKPKNLNQISVAFSGNGRLFKLGIWDYDTLRAMPGKLLWDSDSLRTKGGTYIYDLPKSVRVNGSFYVGVRQLDLSNVAFGYQMEEPVRPATFFYAVPLGDTNWVDFHPGAPYKFIIEPRLQADYDLVALNISLPKDTFNVHDKDTVGPVARIGNIGVNDFSDSIRVRCIIKGPNILHYDESVYDTLGSGLTRDFNLPKTFKPWEYGVHRMTLIVSHYRDQVVDNDTLIKTFVVGSRRDVSIRSSYPSGNSTFIARKDTLQPISTIMNIAVANSGSFKVFSEIWLGDSLISKESQTLQLGSQGSQILVWSTYPCNDTGRLKWLVFTALSGDEYTPNDTAIFKAFVYKVVDVAAETIVSPDSTSIYAVNENIDVRARLYNEGVLRADNVKMIFEIYDAAGIKRFVDSLVRNVNGRAGQTFLFAKKFRPTKKGAYKAKFYLADSVDLYKENDAIQSNFFVGRASDYYLDSISLPKTMSTDPVGRSWSVVLGNLGYDSTLKQADIKATISRNKTVWFDESLKAQVLPDKRVKLNFKKPFKPLFTGVYKVEVVVTHTADRNQTNDTLRENIIVQIGKDALMDSIGSPQNNQIFYLNDRIDSSLVRFRNQGIDTLNQVILRTQLVFEKALYYQYSDTVNLAPGEVITQWLPTASSFNSLGKGFFRAWLQHPKDEDKSNDTLTHYYEVRSKRDLNIVLVDSPARGSVYQTGNKVYPIIYIANTGMDSAVFSGKLVLSVSKNGQAWYTERMPFPLLNAGDTQRVQATQVLYFDEEGRYDLLCYAENNQDDNPVNDTFSSAITVKINSSYSIEEAIQVFPNPNNTGELTLITDLPISEVKLLDVLGKEHRVALVTENGARKAIWSPSLAPGTYTLQLLNTQGIHGVRIIVK